MDPTEFRNRLLAVGETIKAKGWATCSINIYTQYLGIFDIEPGPLDPMIHCSPSISASTRDKYGIPTSHQFVRDGHDCKTMEQAMAKLEETAANMPTMEAEAARFAQAKAKLNDDERRLLGVR